MNRRFVALATAAVVAVAAGCDSHEPVVVPPGGQEVHLTIAGGRIAIAPDTVHAGDLYLVIDTDDADPMLVSASRLSDIENGQPDLGFDDTQLERVLQGDALHTMISSGYAAGGEMGRVSRLHLAPGTHVFLTRDFDGRPFAPNEVAILTVTP